MAQVLVVDDSSTVRDEVAGFLKKSGLDVATAVDGRDGLSKLKMDPKASSSWSATSTCPTWTA